MEKNPLSLEIERMQRAYHRLHWFYYVLWGACGAGIGAGVMGMVLVRVFSR